MRRIIVPKLASVRGAAFPAIVIRRVVIILLFAAASSLRAAVPAIAPGGELVMEADEPSIEGATNVGVLKGHARISDGSFQLLADEVRYDNNTHVATALGHVVFTRGEVRLLADRLVYHRRDGTFTADNIRLGSYPYFVEGFSASGSRDEITVRRARASYGEPGPWQPTINADTLIFAPGKQLRSENVTVGIGHAQPVPIPRFDHRLGAPLIGTVNLTGGYHRPLGVFADGTLLVPLRPGLRLGTDLGVFTERGVMIGPAGRYSNFEDPEALSGYFRSGYIRDHGDRKTDLLGQPIPPDRAFVEWQHQQVLAPNLTLAAQLNWWKDSEVLRDFRPRAFFPVQQPDTFIESVYSGSNYFVSAFARFQPNKFHRVQERLPEVRFDLLPLAVGNGFVERFEASAVRLREDPPPVQFTNVRTSGALAGLPGGDVGTVIPGSARTETVITTMDDPPRHTTRLDAYYAIERPFAPVNWFVFTPHAGGRFTYYAQTPAYPIVGVLPNQSYVTRPVFDSGSYRRMLGELGFDAALRSNGTFEYKNPQWKIDGLRHLLTPRLSYRYIPEGDKGRAYIPPIDREGFSTYLQPLGLGDQRNIDDLHKTNTLRLQIDNVLQTRDAVFGTRDLLALNVANDFRFHRRPGERDVSEIHTELALTPARWLQVDVYESFAPQNFKFREFNSGVTLRDGRFWSVRFGNNYLRGNLQDYLVDGRVRINERFEALMKLQYDERRHRFNEQAYGIVQNLGNTWLISYTVSLYSGRRRESSFGFNVQIDTVRF